MSRNNKGNNKKVSVYSYLTLVPVDKTYFTKQQVDRLDRARNFPRKLGYASYKRFFKLLKTRYFTNFPITVGDLKSVLYKNEVDVKTLTDKTNRRKTIQINNIIETPVSPTILDLHPTINFLEDCFFMQELMFLRYISRGCGFCTVERLRKYR